MRFKGLFLFMAVLSLSSLAWAGKAPLFCQLADAKNGEAYLQYYSDQGILGVTGSSSDLQLLEGLRGDHEAIAIDQTKGDSPNLRDDILIHFTFENNGAGSVRFYNALKTDGLIPAEFFAGFNTLHFIFECCPWAYPIQNQDQFSCQN